MLEKGIAKIDWENKTAKKKKNLVRGLNPIMGAYTFLDEKKIKFWKVQTLEFEEFTSIHNGDIQDVTNIENGKVLISNDKEGLFIKSKDGIISVLEIQGENAKRMSIYDFLRGNKIELKEIFK